MTMYAKLDVSHEVLCFVGLPDPGGMGPPEPAPDDGGEYRLMPGSHDLGPRPYAEARVVWPIGADSPVWGDVRPITEIRAGAITTVDQVADAARLAVVGDAARIKEYERAQAGAEAYRDAGYAGPVPPAVASWAHAKRRENWTARQAADDILAASARWYSALDAIRALRLDAKESIRAAETAQEVATTTATFRATLHAVMTGVQ